MSILITRIGSNLQKFKNLVRRDGFIFYVKTFKGVRIAGMTSCSRVLANKGCNTLTNSEHQSSKDLKQTGTDIIYDLHELVNRRAKEVIKADIDKHENLPDFHLNWSGVEIRSDKPCTEHILKSEVVEGVSSNTILKNDSSLDQTHKLRVEREMSTQCDSFLTKGFKLESISCEIALKDIGKLGFSGKFPLKNGKMVAGDKIGWVFEDSIKVPKGSTIVVSIKSKEKQSEFLFDTQIGVKGDVIGTFYHTKKKKTREFTISMNTVINEEIPERMINQEDDFTYIEITGRGKVKYDLDHEVNISSK